MSLHLLPNAISVARMLLVAPVIWLLLGREFGWALVLFSVAGISDAVDGYLAKRCGWTSRLGTVLDPLADKLLLLSTYLVLGVLVLLPWWLIALVVVRDLVIVGGAFAFRWCVGPFEGRPTVVSKINTFLQICLVVAVLAGQRLVALPTAAVPLLVGGVALFGVLSGGNYVWVWSRRAARELASRRRGGP